MRRSEEALKKINEVFDEAIKAQLVEKGVEEPEIEAYRVTFLAGALAAAATLGDRELADVASYQMTSLADTLGALNK